MQRRPRRHPDSAYRDVSGEGGLVVLPGLAEVKVVNPAGSFIFRRLDGNHTVDEIVQAVCEEFEVSEENAARDIEEFLGELARHRMLADSESEGVAQ